MEYRWDRGGELHKVRGKALSKGRTLTAGHGWQEEQQSRSSAILPWTAVESRRSLRGVILHLHQGNISYSSLPSSPFFSLSLLSLSPIFSHNMLRATAIHIPRFFSKPPPNQAITWVMGSRKWEWGQWHRFVLSWTNSMESWESHSIRGPWGMLSAKTISSLARKNRTHRGQGLKVWFP